jgi:hypothetical protein
MSARDTAYSFLLQRWNQSILYDIRYDIRYDISYDIGYDISISIIGHDIGHDICICNIYLLYSLPVLLRESKDLVVRSLAEEELQMP